MESLHKIACNFRFSKQTLDMLATLVTQEKEKRKQEGHWWADNVNRTSIIESLIADRYTKLVNELKMKDDANAKAEVKKSLPKHNGKKRPVKSHRVNTRARSKRKGVRS